MNAVPESPAPEARLIGTPPMREFNVSNHLLGNRAALDAAWDRDGYWFFRNVLDKGAIARLRAVFLQVLDQLGVIDPSRTDAAVYNGASLENFPIVMGGDPAVDPLLARHPMRQFVAEPAIHAFFTRLFGDEPFWVPNTEYHAVPPNPKHNGNRFNYVHADGANNKGLPLRICWIPLAPIDEATGGLALTEGLHKPRMNDFPRPPAGIGQDVVPADAWRRTEWQPGDLVVFSLETPHSGLANRSDRYFRLSTDIRGMRKSDHIPTIGTVAAIDANAVTIVDDSGKRHTFRLNEDTFCRIARGRLSGMPLQLAEIPQLVKVGDPVYVASNRGTAVFMRPQH
jgi:ectoine hydroxylase-related dioxygenase (phytanoyl-CoA dioxygenase family)